jgi:hypothetical protein
MKDQELILAALKEEFEDARATRDDSAAGGFTHFSEYWDGVMKGLNVAKRIIENKSRVKTWTVTRNFFWNPHKRVSVETFIVCNEQGVQVCSDKNLRNAVESALRIAAAEKCGPVNVVGDASLEKPTEQIRIDRA